MADSACLQFNLLVDELKVDTQIRAVVLTSAVPKVFCAGADLKERKTMNINEVRVSAEQFVAG